MNNIQHILCDADDTLWENNIFYESARKEFIALCTRHNLNQRKIEQDFISLETQIVHDKGYGTINFILILETLCKKLLPPSASPEFESMLDRFVAKIRAPRTLLPGVKETLVTLRQNYSIYVLTKGDFDEQSEKLTRAGLYDFFHDRFIVSEKNEFLYRSILKQKSWIAETVCMVGNSPKSDINPALRSGMWAVFIPYHQTWYMEDEPLLSGHEKLFRANRFDSLQQIFAANGKKKY
jgi:putative hydrolase of the HAD superfamily